MRPVTTTVAAAATAGKSRMPYSESPKRNTATFAITAISGGWST